MGLTQTKLHHKILKQSWSSTLSHLDTPAGLRNARQPNPLGDLPLHLACYTGQAPPAVIRALILAYPAAAEARNDEGFRPAELVRINYRRDGPHRGAVLELLEDDGSSSSLLGMAREVARRNGTGSAVVLGAPSDRANRPGGLMGDGRAGARGAGPGGGGGGGAAVVDTTEMKAEHTYQTSTTCVVCLDAEADHVVVPCGHVCLCGDCAGKVMRRRGGLCPVGRCVVGNICLVEIGCGGTTREGTKKGGGKDRGGATSIENEAEDRDGADEEEVGRSRGKGEELTPPRMVSEDEVDDDAATSGSATMVC